MIFYGTMELISLKLLADCLCWWNSMIRFFTRHLVMKWIISKQVQNSNNFLKSRTLWKVSWSFHLPATFEACFCGALDIKGHNMIPYGVECCCSKSNHYMLFNKKFQRMRYQIDPSPWNVFRICQPVTR